MSHTKTKSAVRSGNCSAVNWKPALKSKWLGIPSLLFELRGRFRAALGLCPHCNSDAPELYACWVCHGYTWNRNGVPTKATKRQWLHRWNTGEDLPNANAEQREVKS